MSIRVKLDSLNEELREKIANGLEFKTKPSHYSKSFSFGQDDGKTVYAFDIRGDYIHIPFYFAQETLSLNRPERNTFRKTSLKFNGTLRKLQKEVKKEAIKLLNKSGCCIISLYTGGGKTAVAINITISIRLPTLVVVTRLIIMDQWESSIKKFCPEATIQKVTVKNPPKDGIDFYLVNAINVPKFPENSFNNVGTLIADEMHLLGTEKLSNAFHHTYPRYTIGLSATPTRPDGLDTMLQAYFGNKQVHRKLFRDHTVYKVETWRYITVELEKRMNNRGTLDWNALLNSQALSQKRNEIICSIVTKFPERNFLILCKRIQHTKILEKMFTERDVDVTSLVGIKRHFDTNARVLVATVQKAGVGFDHPKLNALIMAADVEQYFIQYLGRVFRTQEGVPLIFDLVDNFQTLKRHFSSRSRVYRQHGGVIKMLHKVLPEILDEKPK